MHLDIKTRGDLAIVTIRGHVDATATGPLCDRLVERVRAGCDKLLVEFADGATIARPAVRGLVVAATLMRNARKPMRVAAGPDVASVLRRSGFIHLLPVDRDRITALSRLAARAAATSGSEPASAPGTKHAGAAVARAAAFESSC